MTHQKNNQENDRNINGAVTGVATRQCGAKSDNCGFTLLELLVVVAIIGVLAIIASAGFERAKTMARTSRAGAEIRTLEKSIVAYYTDKNVYPGSLAEIGQGDRVDPWGHPYEYQRLDDITVALEDGASKPYNLDFDLYSKGRDGGSLQTYDPGTPSSSDDDIIRAGDGMYVGTRSKF